MPRVPTSYEVALVPLDAAGMPLHRQLYLRLHKAIVAGRLSAGVRLPSSRALAAAWVRFPELTVEPLQQMYERLGDHEYMYSSRGGSFKAKITVDSHGVVVGYEGGWERIGSTL